MNPRYHEMLALIAVDEGYPDTDSLIEHSVFQSVIPGCCRHCMTVSYSCEPDARDNWCEECENQTVASVLVLAGYC